MDKLATSSGSKNNSKLDGGFNPKLAALPPNVSFISGKRFENLRTRLVHHASPLGDVLSEILSQTKMRQQKSIFFVPLEYRIWRARWVRGHFIGRMDVTSMSLKASEMKRNAGCRYQGGPLGVPLQAYAQMMPSGRSW